MFITFYVSVDFFYKNSRNSKNFFCFFLGKIDKPLHSAVADINSLFHLIHVCFLLWYLF